MLKVLIGIVIALSIGCVFGIIQLIKEIWEEW